jgi:hypothetical protein
MMLSLDNLTRTKKPKIRLEPPSIMVYAGNTPLLGASAGDFRVLCFLLAALFLSFRFFCGRVWYTVLSLTLIGIQWSHHEVIKALDIPQAADWTDVVCVLFATCVCTYWVGLFPCSTEIVDLLVLMPMKVTDLDRRGHRFVQAVWPSYWIQFQ